MKLNQTMVSIAVVSALGLAMANNASAAEGEAVSFIMIQDIGVTTATFPDSVFITTEDDFPGTNAGARKSREGVPAVAAAAAGTQLDVDQACVTEVGGVLQDTPDNTLPCPGPNIFAQVGPPVIPFLNFARGDAVIEAVAGFTAVDGSQGIPGNDQPDANLIAEIQVNASGDVARGDSDVSDTFRITFPEIIPDGIPLPTAGQPNQLSEIVFTFDLDWCREAQLGPMAAGVSIARAETTGNIQIETAAGEIVFSSNIANPDVQNLNGVTTAPSPGPQFDALDVFGNTAACFPRPGPDGIAGGAGAADDGEKKMVTVNTNPDGLTVGNCAAAGSACFLPEFGVEYLVTVTAGTIADGQVVEQVEEIGVKKWYFGKQNPPFNDTDNMKLPFPKILSNLELNDQFGQMFVDVIFLNGLMTPAGKNEEVDPARTDHWSCYKIAPAFGQSPGLPIGEVPFETQNFGPDTAQVRFVEELCVSAMKNSEGIIDNTAFKCYIASSGQSQGPVTLDDQFDIAEDEDRPVQGLSRFCTPAGKGGALAPDVVEDINDPTTWRHKACYDIPRRRISPFIDVALGDMIIEQAFGQLGKKITFSTEFERRFCEPAIKLLDLEP